MIIKTVNRNIPEDRENKNDRFRVRYKDKSTFTTLEVNVVRIKTKETITYKFTSDDLPNKDSIYFTTSVNKKDEFVVDWKGIEPKNEKIHSFQKPKQKYKTSTDEKTQIKCIQNHFFQ